MRAHTVPASWQPQGRRFSFIHKTQNCAPPPFRAGSRAAASAASAGSPGSTASPTYTIARAGRQLGQDDARQGARATPRGAKHTSVAAHRSDCVHGCRRAQLLHLEPALRLRVRRQRRRSACAAGPVLCPARSCAGSRVRSLRGIASRDTGRGGSRAPRCGKRCPRRPSAAHSRAAPSSARPRPPGCHPRRAPQAAPVCCTARAGSVPGTRCLRRNVTIL